MFTIMHEYLYLLNLPVSSPSRGVHGNSKRADLVEGHIRRLSTITSIIFRSPSPALSSLDHLSKVGHDGLLVVGSERVVAGDANSGGCICEVVPVFFIFFVVMIDYFQGSYRIKITIITMIIESYNSIAFVSIQKVGLAS